MAPHSETGRCSEMVQNAAKSPYQRKDAVGIDVVLPVTLESNVIKLHEFLYPEDSYTPSEEVKAYSQRIVDKSGFGEESRLDHSEDGSLAAYRESDTE